MVDETEAGRDVQRYQKLVIELRDKLCGGNTSELARRIGRDASYVTRLLYPPDREGRKGFGLTIIDAFNNAFMLPPGFWNLNPPVLTPELVSYLKGREQSREQAERRKARFAPPTGAELAAMGINVPVVGALNDAHLAAGGVHPAMQQIRAWEHEDDLPPGEYAMVPRLNVKLSAGPGSGANQLSFDFDDGQLRAYSAEWIRRHRLKPNKLRVTRADGRSMEPTIFHEDDLLIDTSQTEVVDGKVYALWYEGGERVKRLYRMPGGGLRIRSDNEREFPEIVLEPEYTGHVRIIGRVIDRSGPGGL